MQIKGRKATVFIINDIILVCFFILCLYFAPNVLSAVGKLILILIFANGILLPVIAGFLLFAMNRKQLLGVHANNTTANILGGCIVVIMLGFGARLILLTLGLI